MTYRLISAPAALALSLADAKAALKIDTADQDGQVTAWVAGIVAHAEHLTGRAFVTQTWRLTLDAFPSEFELQRPPILVVLTVKYLDVDGVLQTLASTEYKVDNESEPGRLVPAFGKSWPTTREDANAVQVEYTAGYGPTDATVPPDIKLYLIAKLREQYDPSVKPERVTVQSSFLDRVLDGKMVYA